MKQVWITLLWYFLRYSWLSVVLFKWNDLWCHHFLICITWKRKYLENEKIFQKGKRHSSWLWKAFQLSSNYFLLHRHFKGVLPFCSLFFCSPKMTQPCSQVLLVNGSVITYLTSFWLHWFNMKNLSTSSATNLANSSWLWWIMCMVLTNQKQGNN